MISLPAQPIMMMPILGSFKKNNIFLSLVNGSFFPLLFENGHELKWILRRWA